jgi:isochorismate hydrolase
MLTDSDFMGLERMKEGAYTEKQVLDLARRAYEEGSADFEVVPENCALLVIDMQDEFVKPRWTPYWVPEATRQVPRIKRLVEHCRKKGYPLSSRFFQEHTAILTAQKQGLQCLTAIQS